jgi:hypothetical protein
MILLWLKRNQSLTAATLREGFETKYQCMDAMRRIVVEGSPIPVRGLKLLDGVGVIVDVLG